MEKSNKIIINATNICNYVNNIVFFNIDFGIEPNHILLNGTLKIKQSYTERQNTHIDILFIEDGSNWNQPGAIMQCGYHRNKFHFISIQDVWHNGVFAMTIYTNIVENITNTEEKKEKMS
jgi:hypothetical protein